MEILILGGTRFVGRHMVEDALARGHQVTLFNRGRSNDDLFPEVERLKGDRNEPHEALKGRQWDAVIDTSAYVPRQVQLALDVLQDATQHYTFISTISVYDDFSVAGNHEGSPLATLDDETTEEITGETYGGLKVLCEQHAQARIGEKLLIMRPGIIVGPYDHTDRFVYWGHRIADGGEVLAPEPKSSPVQFIDGRDLAAFTLDQVEASTTGIFNATGPDHKVTMQNYLETAVQVTDGAADLVWMDADFLLENNVGPFRELPFWLPMEDRSGTFQIDSRKAIAAGLTYRATEDIIRDTLAWSQSRPVDHEWRAGMDRDKEADLIKQWHARS